MKYVLRILVNLLAVSIADVSVAAAKKAKAPRAPKAGKAKAVLKELTLTGTVSKVEKKGRGGKATAAYVLTDAAGNKITLPQPKGQDAANLADFIDKNVTVVGKGTETKRGEKTSIRLSRIVSIEAAGGEADVDVPMADDGDF